MAKHMQDKESMAGITWLALLIIAGWGGLVRFLMDVKQGKSKMELDKCFCADCGFGFYRGYWWAHQH